jgi:hypothetical protein
MNREKIIEAWTEVGRCEADEHALGVQLIELTIAQRKAHEATRSARDIAEHLLNDNN